MSANDLILPGAQVKLHLSIALEDGTEALSTFGEEPISLTIGDGTLQASLELALYGLKAGDTQTLNLLPEQAYGTRDLALIRYMPMTDFDGTFTPQSGQVVAFSLANGEEAPGIILQVDEGRIEVDFNHPLAGHQITFRADILEVMVPTTDPPAGT